MARKTARPLESIRVIEKYGWSKKSLSERREKKHTTNGKLSKTGQESKTCPKHELLRNLMTWHDANRMLPPEQWQLALTHVVAAWLKADKTKTGQGVFRKDKLKKAGWVVRCGGGDMNQESSLEDSYADLVVARALE